MKLLPFFFTEIQATGPISKACRTATIANCMMDATDNEAALNDKGRHRSKAGRLAVVRTGWSAFLRQTPADANGWADQGDVLLMKRAMFPGYPDPIVTRKPPSEVWSDIGDYSVSLAIDTSVIPASSPVRKWVGAVPHQGKAYKRMTANGVKWVKWVCPMHPASDTFAGVWVRWSHLVKGAKALPGAQGEMFVELFPRGQWTAERRKAASKNKQLAVVNTRNARLEDNLDAAVVTIQHQKERIAELEGGQDTEAARIAALDQAKAAASEAIEDLK